MNSGDHRRYSRALHGQTARNWLTTALTLFYLARSSYLLKYHYDVLHKLWTGRETVGPRQPIRGVQNNSLKKP